MKKTKIHQQIEEEEKKEFQEKHRARVRIEEEKVLEKNRAAGEEFLDYVAQPNEEKGADAVIEVQRQVEKREREEKEMAEHILKRSRRLFNDDDYEYKLAKRLYKMATLIDWPAGYQWTIDVKKRKIALIFMSPNGDVYGSGIKLSFEPKFDLHGLAVLTTRCENTVDKIEGNLAWQRKSKKGIIYGPDGKVISLYEEGRTS